MSAGPSLNTSVNLLKEVCNDSFVISVGSALKVLLSESIIPDAVIITDPSDNVMNQIKDTNYSGPLFYMSTANHKMTSLHHFKRYIIFQRGFKGAEKYAADCNIPLLETGGSVATTALSLLDFMSAKEVYLFGQDFGFKDDNTHAIGSTSGVPIAQERKYRKVQSNKGGFIYTAPNLRAYHRWFEKKAEQTTMKIFNTSLDGAKIKGVPFISEKELLTKIQINTG